MHQLPNKELLPRYHKIPVQRFLFSLASQLPTNKLHVAAQVMRKEILSNRTLNVQTFTPATTVTKVLKQGRAHLCPRRHYSKPPSLKLYCTLNIQEKEGVCIWHKTQLFDKQVVLLHTIRTPTRFNKAKCFWYSRFSSMIVRPPVPTHLKECKTLDWK